MNDINEAYIERIEAGFQRLDASIRAIDERLRIAETREAGFTPLINSRLDAAWKKIDAHQEELKILREDLATLTHSVNQLSSIMRWLLGIFTSCLVAFLIAIATGHMAITLVP